MSVVKNDNEVKKVIISDLFSRIMKTLGLDLTDDSLKGTPDRLAKLYVDEWFSSLKENSFPRMMTVKNKMGYDQMLIERDIKVMSTCEHHFCPIMGKAHVAYIPKDKVIGLSKLNRIVDYYCRKPQIQERLTKEIHDRLVKELGTKDVAVIVDSIHTCVITRGVQDVNSSTITSSLGWIFKKDSAVRKEFLDLIKLKNG